MYDRVAPPPNLSYQNNLWRQQPWSGGNSHTIAVYARAPAGQFLTVERPILPIVLMQFEKTENKPIVIAYIAAAAFALITAEWLIHLPALNVVRCRQTAFTWCLA